jgi:hypothetical protein
LFDCAAGSEDWGAAALAEALYTASTDVARMQGVLPELSPADRSLLPLPLARHMSPSCCCSMPCRLRLACMLEALRDSTFYFFFLFFF